MIILKLIAKYIHRIIVIIAYIIIIWVIIDIGIKFLGPADWKHTLDNVDDAVYTILKKIFKK